MKKVVVKTAFLTFAVVFAVAVIALVVLFFGFPQTAADMFENTGDYKSAARFAAIRYSRTDDIDDLGRVVMDSILAADDEYVEKYGQELIAKKGFDEYCAREDEYYGGKGEISEYTSSFKQFIYGSVSRSVYRNGDFDKALELSESALGEGTSEFKPGNALAALSIEACVRKDAEAAARLKTVLGKYSPPAGQDEYLNFVKNALESIS